MARNHRAYPFFAYERGFAPAPTATALSNLLGRPPNPVRGEGRKLAKTFWGLAWCRNLEHYQDYANRLPRGRTYLRKGTVLDLAIHAGHVEALVMGSSLYQQRIEIDPVDDACWAKIRSRCVGKLASLIDLLEGKVPDEVMRAVTEPGKGLFPEPREVGVLCTCPDSAKVCKHLAAVLYGIGVRLDAQPELLFRLRGVTAEDLIDVASIASSATVNHEIPAQLLSEVFGVLIDNHTSTEATVAKKSAAKTGAAKQADESAAKKAAAKKTTKTTAKKSEAKKATATKTAAKKATATKTAAKKTTAAKKATTTKESTARKAAAQKTTKKALAKKTAQKSTATKTTKKALPKKVAKPSAAKKATAKKTTVKKKLAVIRSSRNWIDDEELRARGISRAEVRNWVREGYVLVVDDRDGYRLLPESRRRLQERAREIG